MEEAEFLQRYAVDRHHSASLKWDGLQARYGDPDLTALWVADMDFKVAEPIQEALHERIDEGVFGYSLIPASYQQAFIDWEARRHQVSVDQSWLRTSAGVVSELYRLVNTFTQPGDSVIVQTPVYYPFLHAVTDNHRHLVDSPLRQEGGRYTMDYADFEAKVAANDVKLFILCSPHNPAGRVWTEDELAQVLAICQRHHVLVVADEIHQDITFTPHTQCSTLRVAGGRYRDQLIVCTAPSKTFNLAALLNSLCIIPNATLRHRYDDEAQRFNQVEKSVLGLVAGEAAYRYGDEWLDSVLGVIAHNFKRMRQTLATAAPAIKVYDLEGTYLAWLDLRGVVAPAAVHQFVQDQCQLAVDYGEWFGAQAAGFIRLNLATTPANVDRATARIAQAAKTWHQDSGQ